VSCRPANVHEIHLSIHYPLTSFSDQRILPAFTEQYRHSSQQLQSSHQRSIRYLLSLRLLVFMIMIKRICWSALTVSMFLAPLKYLPAGTVNALFNTAPIIVCFVEAVRYKVNFYDYHPLETLECQTFCSDNHIILWHFAHYTT